MGGETRTFAVRQLFYAGVGWVSALLCVAGAYASWYWSSWSSYVQLLFAGVCAFYAVRNAGLVYVLDESGLTISSRWGTRRYVRWSTVSRMKYFEMGKTLILLLKNGQRRAIRCGELQDPMAFYKEVQRMASMTGAWE